MKASDVPCIARGLGQGGALDGVTTVHCPRMLLHSSATQQGATQKAVRAPGTECAHLGAHPASLTV